MRKWGEVFLLLLIYQIYFLDSFRRWIQVSTSKRAHTHNLLNFLFSLFNKTSKHAKRITIIFCGGKESAQSAALVQRKTYKLHGEWWRSIRDKQQTKKSAHEPLILVLSVFLPMNRRNFDVQQETWRERERKKTKENFKFSVTNKNLIRYNFITTQIKCLESARKTHSHAKAGWEAVEKGQKFTIYISTYFPYLFCCPCSVSLPSLILSIFFLSVSLVYVI